MMATFPFKVEGNLPTELVIFCVRRNGQRKPETFTCYEGININAQQPIVTELMNK